VAARERNTRLVAIVYVFVTLYLHLNAHWQESTQHHTHTITRTRLNCYTGLVSPVATHIHTELAKSFYHELASRTDAATSKERWKEGGGVGSNVPPVVLALDSAFVETQNGLPTELPVSMVRCSSIVASPRKIGSQNQSI